MTDSPAKPSVRRVEADGMSLLELGRPRDPVELVFLHATGFHAALYADVLAPLAQGRRILAPDLRGHGCTRLPADPASMTSWAPFIADLHAVLAALDRPVTLAGHSLGASVSLLAAPDEPEKVRSLALFEPVIRPKATAAMADHPDESRVSARTLEIARITAGRRRRFPSKQEALTSYRGRGGFKTWPEAALQAYVDEGFVEDGDGVTLRCDPAWEAAVYLAAGGDFWGAAERARVPIVVRAGAQNTTFSPDSEQKLLALRPDADVGRIAGTSHHMPIERPDVVREAIERALAT